MRSKADAVSGDRTDSRRAGVIARAGSNLGWLAGSTVISAIASLIYVALAARTLGPPGFGRFALLMTYGELVANLVQFQSWKAVIGFGATHLQSSDGPRLRRLFGYTASLDWLSAIAGSLISVVGVLSIGPLLHWSQADEYAAAWFGTALLLTSGTTAAGILRLRSRFDLQVYSEVIAQVTRLIGCLVGWYISAGVAWFLFVWALAAALQLLTQWSLVVALGDRLTIGIRALRLAHVENRGLWSFMLKTNLSSSVSLFWMQCGTLIVGARAGAVDAGAFRLAYRFSQALLKPVEIATKALFPELAKLVASGDRTTLRVVLVKVSGIAAVFAMVAVLGAGMFGQDLLRVVAGTRFGFAQSYLFPLSIAAAIGVAGFALEPFLNAHFRAGAVLRAYVVGALIYGLLLAFLLPSFGARAAAFAAIAGATVIFVQMAISAARIIDSSDRRRAVDSAPSDAAAAQQAETGLFSAVPRTQPVRF